MPINSLADMELLFADLPLEQVSTSMTINATASILLAMYVAVAEKRGVPVDRIDGTTDDYLLTTTWKLLVKGQVVMEQPRHIVVFETFNHLAHHRGQLTVYLRLLERPVPAIYGPSADDQRFA